MKQQIARLSPHQNGKVFGILMAIGSLAFLLPIMVIFWLSPPNPDAPPAFIFMLFPVFYLIFGYLSIALGCWLYNTLFKYIGGIEFEARNED